jgi:hypothetical protein
MPTSELFRFRTVRPVEAKKTEFASLAVTSKVTNPEEMDPGSVLGTFNWLQVLSDQLANAGDTMSPGAVVALLPTDWLTQVASASWKTLAQNLADVLALLALKVKNTNSDTENYGISIIPPALCGDVELIARLILVQNFVATLAADQSLPQEQRQFQNARDVRLALSFRCVALPPVYFRRAQPILARQPGVTDLSVVRDEWNRYIPGELANVVNVLPGETLATSSRHSEKTVHTESATTQRTTTQTTENSQTTTQNLSSTTTDDVSTNIGVQGQVETSGQYGPTTIKTTLGAQIQISKSSATTTALTRSMETVARAVKTVSETITQSQTTRTTIKDASSQKHSVQNNTADVVVGMYRWLLEVHRVQLVNYPNRFVVEFEIPEPGAWLRYALQNQPDAPWDTPDPGLFALNKNDPRLDPSDLRNADRNPVPLQPTDLTPSVAAGLAARWRVQGITSPPPSTITLAFSYKSKDGFNDNTMQVPEGYVANAWFLNVTGVAANDPGGHDAQLRVSVGGYGVTCSVSQAGEVDLFSSDGNTPNLLQKHVGNNTFTPDGRPPVTFPVGDITTGSIPVSFNNNGFLNADSTLNVVIQCGQLEPDVNNNDNGKPYRDWQLDTFNLIVAAYQNLVDAHNQERNRRLQTKSTPLVVGPSELNKARAAAELKRLAIQNLLGLRSSGYDLLTIGPVGPNGPIPDVQQDEPVLNMSNPNTILSTPVVQFFEQAFEWENIVYVCYPYFWGGKKRWVQNATTATTDAIFDQFLNAGSARLVVPARPGFEHLVNFYLYTSSIWSGQSPPGPNEPGYLSIADEIQTIQVGAADGTPIYPPWEIVLPTTLLWAGTDPKTLPVNPNPTIEPPPAAPASVVIEISSSNRPSVFGQPVTFRATLTAVTGAGAAVPTGQVNFLVDGAPTPDSPVILDASGTAVCAGISTLTVGPHTVWANYVGDSTFGAAIVNLPTQIVTQGLTSVTITGNPNPAVHRTPVTFTATVAAVAPARGIPTGEVVFIVDRRHTQDSPVALDNRGAATCAVISTLARGAHTVLVNYLGDANFAAGTGSMTETTT